MDLNCQPLCGHAVLHGAALIDCRLPVGPGRAAHTSLPQASRQGSFEGIGTRSIPALSIWLSLRSRYGVGAPLLDREAILGHAGTGMRRVVGVRQCWCSAQKHCDRCKKNQFHRKPPNVNAQYVLDGLSCNQTNRWRFVTGFRVRCLADRADRMHSVSTTGPKFPRPPRAAVVRMLPHSASSRGLRSTRRSAGAGHRPRPRRVARLRRRRTRRWLPGCS